MECNKEEAIRAKSIAEKKMQSNDFMGARKFALKAQRLFPELEDLSQMLTVCAVHCAAQNKVNEDMDWYTILQVDITADDSSIKKQYRKLALLLHPDKNKFAGAEAAFKLIGEAHRLLLDRPKRALHDMLRSKATVGSFQARPPSQKSDRSPRTRKRSETSRSTSSSTSTDLNQQPQAPSSVDSNTFWTICPYCSIRYQYSQHILNKSLHCQDCLKTFTAFDYNAHGLNTGRDVFGTPQQEFPSSSANNVDWKAYFGNASCNMASECSTTRYFSKPHSPSGPEKYAYDGGGYTDKGKESGEMAKEFGKCNEPKIVKVKIQDASEREEVVKPPSTTASQKSKIVIESSHSEGDDSDVVVSQDGVQHVKQTFQTAGSRYLQRLSGQKRTVSYSGINNDDDDLATSNVKRLRKDQTCGVQREKASPGDHGVDIVSDCGKNERNYGVFPSEEHSASRVKIEKTPKMRVRELGTAEGDERLKADAGSVGKLGVDEITSASPDVDCFTYPDPEFFDFEKERDESKFAVDQIWGIYDSLNGMPRYYARIRKIYTPGFKLCITWLEHDPMNKAEMEWSEKDLPVACGNFRMGGSEDTEDQLMFSHIMPCARGAKRNSYIVYPRKGEIWALFKDWNMQWTSIMSSNKQYEYEIVEVLSDYAKDSGVTVVRLVRIKGFVSLFMRAAGNETALCQIPVHELLRFSHMVPSYRMTGEEREGIPNGSFELDPASLPDNFQVICPSISFTSLVKRCKNLDSVSNGFRSKSVAYEMQPSTALQEMVNGLKNKHIQEKGKRKTKDPPDWKNENHFRDKNQARQYAGEMPEHVAMQGKEEELRGDDQLGLRDGLKLKNEDVAVHHCVSAPLSPEYYLCPEPEFHNFEEERSVDNFRCGQIWALYSEIDMYPNYYGRIEKIDLEDFKVHVKWLQACPADTPGKTWLRKRLPVGCGTFKLIKETGVFDGSNAFSHLVQVALSGAKDQFEVYPSTGQVWAVFKNWNSTWNYSDLENCEYDLVEVFGSDDTGIRVLVLTKVSGYRAVFMRQRKEAGEMVIPLNELLRFSHKIPAFRLTEEAGGKLRGYWELDPESVPQVFLFVD